MGYAAPNNLLEVLADYTTQALDAVQGISDEFEDDINELRSRGDRIRTVLKVIHDCRSESLPSHNQQRERGRPIGGAPLKPIDVAIRGLSQLASDLTGLPDVSAPPANPEPAGRSTFRVGALQPLGRPVSLAEATLELFGHNTKIVYRRKEKRPRQPDSADEGTPGTVYSKLSAMQRKRRFAVYTGRVALFPKVFQIPVALKDGDKRITWPFIPPAVREYAGLNVEAECEMLAEFYKLDTKVHLLREWPSLNSTVKHMRELLRAEGVQLSLVGNEQHGKEVPWFEFPSTENGVIRMIVKGALWVDLTWDIPSGERWRVLGLRWLLRCRPAPALVLPPAPDSRQRSAGGCKQWFSALTDGTPLRVEPAYHDMMLRYLSGCFEMGLESGAVGVLRLVDAVTMEAIEMQCQQLRESFFVGPLEPMFAVDVRPGTHVALTLTLPPDSLRTSATVLTTDNSAMPIYLKYKIAAGTIVVEKRRGTDTRTTLCHDFYSESVAEEDGRTVAVVDVERQLWHFAGCW
uniref:WGS project CAEQ00000000 data, annotated contig 329 n=1 Tax=Trypanosoma congolense (strain IL3000) TaxID=1068625 RepID=F9WEZ1_TRYCI|nr:unnamed protein product [Trypanosoma congolense IL3000]